MIKTQTLLFAVLIILTLSCGEKKYLRTKRLSNCGLYIEVFTANSLGLNQEYITDSTDFRIYIGTVDEEHDYYLYECRNDSIYIKKVKPSDKNCRWVILKDSMKTVLCDTVYINRRPISLSTLKTKHAYK